jgi:hypothetical protein
MPGPGPDDARPAAHSGDEPTTALGGQPTAEEPAAAEPSTAPARWTGSAPVPPPSGKKRRRWLATAVGPTLEPPAHRDPTLHLPTEERRAIEAGTPVDPWADADPLDTPYPPTFLEPPQFALPPAPPAPVAPPPPAALPVAPPTPVSPRPAALPAPVPPRRAKLMPAVRKAPAKPTRPPAPPPAPPPPGWRPPSGYEPVRRRRRRRWPWVLLLTLACCCGCPAYFGQPMWDQYPASVTLPAQVSDLRLRDDTASTRAADRLKRDVRSAHLFAENTFAALYADGAGKRVTVFGTTGFRFSPESDLESELTRLTDRYKIQDVEPVDARSRGEHVRCGVGRDSGNTVAVCAWADHGSLATALFTRRSVDDSAALLEDLRTTLVSRD